MALDSCSLMPYYKKISNFTASLPYQLKTSKNEYVCQVVFDNLLKSTISCYSYLQKLPAKGEQVSLGQTVRQRRQFLEITQQELAQDLGITPQHISLIEQDKTAPSLAIVPKLAEQLGVTIDYLLTGKETVITDTIPAIKADKSLKLKAKRLLIGLVEELREPAISNET